MPDFLTPDTVQALLQGAWVTLQIVVLSGLSALLLGLLAAFFRQLSFPPLKQLASGYVWLFRNTPLLIQLYFFYRGLASVGLVLEPFWCGVLSLSLYTGSYIAEVIRSGLQSIPKEQREAAEALGLSPWTTYCWILWPQLIRLIFPALGNQLISMSKNSALVAFITVEDLFQVVYKGAVDAFRPIEYFCIGACLYGLLSLVISGVIGLLERAFKKGGPHHA